VYYKLTNDQECAIVKNNRVGWGSADPV